MTREFGGDSEFLQIELEGDGGWFPSGCADIVQEENRYESTGDARFNPARRSMVGMIIEAYGKQSQVG